MATKTGAQPASRAGPRKRESVETLTDKLGRATSAVVTDYRGLTVAQLEELRGLLRKERVEYVIVKNTLARRAAMDAGVEEFAGALTGPVGLAIGFDDAAVPARILNDYFRVNRRLPIVAGLFEGRLLDAPSVQTLAELPPRDVLLARLAGTLQSPVSNLAGALTSILTTFAATLDAYRVKLEAA